MNFENCFPEVYPHWDQNTRNNEEGVDRVNGYTELEEDSNNQRGIQRIAHLYSFQKFPSQYFETERDCDFVTALAFDVTGDFLAIGDKSGRVAILKRNASSKGFGRTRIDYSSFESMEQRLEPGTQNHKVNEEKERYEDSLVYSLWADFQSHEPEFDYLKSLEIEEKINEIQWCRPCAMNQLLLTTNDKTIKLWKLREKGLSVAASYKPSESHAEYFSENIWNGTGMFRSTFVNKVENPRKTRTVIARTKNIYCNAHAYHINSISLNCDEETFLSSDDLRINIWNLEMPTQAFNVVDIKPEVMEDLNEVITSAKCHPCHCHLFIHSSSKGIVRLCDLRSSALCDRSALDFEQPYLSNSSFFSEIISSISDVEFSPSGEYILARDYMHLLLWDIRMPREPLLKVPVHDYIRSYLCELYENDFIFDKFRCSFSYDGKLLFTGSYDNKVVCCNTVNAATMNYTIEKGPVSNSVGVFHPSHKVLEIATHPWENVVATASGAYVYLHRGY